MRSYGQYCPIARAAEVLGDRWTLLIVREMSFGVRHFNELERCLPGISRSVLSQRLRQLAAAGLIERNTTASGRATEYELTAAGRDLKPALQVLGNWAATWAFADPDPGDLDPDLVMRWISRHVATDQLPSRRVVIQFDVSGPKRRYWLVLDRAEVSVCLHPPGFETDIFLAASAATLYDLYLGRVPLRTLTRDALISIDGPRPLVRTFQRWFTWSSFAPAVRQGLTTATARSGGGPGIRTLDESHPS